MDKILDDIVYGIYLYRYEYVDNDKGKQMYKEFKELAMQEHCGDCTWQSCSCFRCHYEDYFTQAKVILRLLYEKHELGRK